MHNIRSRTQIEITLNQIVTRLVDEVKAASGMPRVNSSVHNFSKLKRTKSGI